MTLSKAEARVGIKYIFNDDPDATYVDTLILKKVRIDGLDVGFWRIDGVIHLDGSDLKSSLAAAFEAG